MTDDFNTSKPIYLQLSDRIYWRILRGELMAGDKLPSVRELAIDSGVNPNTVSKTYSEMEKTGVVEVRRGQGTFVSQNQQVLDELRERLKNEQIATFIQEMTAMGFTASDMIDGLKAHLEKGGYDE